MRCSVRRRSGTERFGGGGDAVYKVGGWRLRTQRRTGKEAWRREIPHLYFGGCSLLL